MGLYGIYGEHTQEACPLYNEENRRSLLKAAPNLEKIAQKYNTKFLGQYHSGLEHTFLWIVEADNAQLIEQLMIIDGRKIQHNENSTFDNLSRCIRNMQENRRRDFFPK